jgi:2-oxoglutarate dehydrogenase E2 component (dihydrolipoamide succinyltransferase)
MPTSVTLPELGESVEGGTLVAWLVAEGDTIARGQAIAEVSTDKVDTEIPSPHAGTVTRLVAAVDGEVPVGGVLLELEVSDSAGADPGPAPGPAPEPAPEPAAAPAATAAPAAPAAPGEPSGEPLSDEAAELRISPLVRRLVREHGLDPLQLRGTGPDGRVTHDDVLAAVAGGTGATGAVRPAAPRAAPAGSRTEKLSRTRKVIAERMSASIRTTAQLTSAVEADVTRIMSLRARVRDAAKARHGVSLSPMAFLAHATVRALTEHPLLNGSIDMEAGTYTLNAGVGLGIAVDAPTGLMVPVIRDAQTLGPVSLQLRIADLAERARSKRITPDDLSGGTFTITNTGSRGSLFDTPILNPPEVGILATPAIEKRPVVVTDADGTDRIAIRHRTYLCLTYDHRLVDGADAARFLGDLARLIDSDDWGPEVDELLS